MSNPKGDQKGIQKEETLQAVLIAHDFDDLFSDYTRKKSSVCSLICTSRAFYTDVNYIYFQALLPIVGRCGISYALEHLGRAGIQETIIFCSSNASEVKNHVA